MEKLVEKIIEIKAINPHYAQPGLHDAYLEGHRDARHAAADVIRTELDQYTFKRPDELPPSDADITWYWCRFGVMGNPFIIKVDKGCELSADYSYAPIQPPVD